MVLLRYYYGATKVLLWCYCGATAVLLRYYGGTTAVLLRCYYGATAVPIRQRPHLYPTPRSLSPHPVMSSSGSDHRMSWTCAPCHNVSTTLALP